MLQADNPTMAGARCRRRSSAADTDLVLAAARAPSRRAIIDARHCTCADHPADEKTFFLLFTGMAGYQVVEADGVPYDEEEGLTRCG